MSNKPTLRSLLYRYGYTVDYNACYDLAINDGDILLDKQLNRVEVLPAADYLIRPAEKDSDWEIFFVVEIHMQNDIAGRSLAIRNNTLLHSGVKSSKLVNPTRYIKAIVKEVKSIYLND